MKVSQQDREREMEEAIMKVNLQQDCEREIEQVIIRSV